MTQSHPQQSPNAQIIDAASEWLIDFNTGDPSPERSRQFDSWLRQSPQHVQAYLEMLTLWDSARGLDRNRQFSSEELIELARSADANVIPLRGTRLAKQRQGTQPAKRRRLYLVTAASVLITALAVLAHQVFHAGTYTTEVGEQRSIKLSDGSTVELNSNSRIRIRFREQERVVDLVTGQALFSVAKDPNRPFIVSSGATRVRAVGTQFDVYRQSRSTVITVIEGRVAVTAPPPAVANTQLPPANSTDTQLIYLAAGEQLRTTPAELGTPQSTDVAAATAWTQHRLIFSRTPLTEVAREFNRYNDRALIVADTALQSFNISGVFSSADSTALILFLKSQPGIRVEETGREIRLTRK